MRAMKSLADVFRMLIIQDYLTGLCKGFLERKFNLSGTSVINV